MIFERGNVSPVDGGCWICWTDREVGQPDRGGAPDWLISHEWDARVHASCLRMAAALMEIGELDERLADEVRPMLERDFPHLQFDAA